MKLDGCTSAIRSYSRSMWTPPILTEPAIVSSRERFDG